MKNFIKRNSGKVRYRKLIKCTTSIVKSLYGLGIDSTELNKLSKSTGLSTSRILELLHPYYIYSERNLEDLTTLLTQLANDYLITNLESHILDRN